jgi:hypothetical protein
MYESVFYTGDGPLSDNTTYYFRVRGVNNVGTGPWSNVDSIRVNVQDRPVIDASPRIPCTWGHGGDETSCFGVPGKRSGGGCVLLRV